MQFESVSGAAIVALSGAGKFWHFQVMDQPSSLGARALPFTFEHMRRRFRFFSSMNDEGHQTLSGKPMSIVPVPDPGELRLRMPLTFDVLDFDSP